MTKVKLNSKLIFVSTLLFICLLLMLFSYNNPTQFLKLREKGYLLGDLLYSFSLGTKETLADFVESVTQTKKIKKENELLKRKLNELTFKQKSYYQEIEIANQRLQDLLSFKQHVSFNLIPAKTVVYSLGDFFKVIYINRGKEDGVKEGMEVVNAEGLVGKVVEVYPNGAKVMLIVDKRSKVGVRVQRTRDIGILQGTGNPQVCELHYILTRADVKVGDTVVTSGLGGIFSPGIVVGYISSIEKKPNYVFQEIQVEPAVDFGKMEEVFLIKEEIQ